MNVVLTRCAGLDVHKRNITGCAIINGRKSIAEFGATTGELLRLSDWLAELEVTHVAMESAGVYWKPVYNLLEVAGFELLLVNARHMKAVPGRKTDIKDAEWIADLLRHGLLTASFVPKREQRELRELTRHRRKLVEQRSRAANRIQHVLEGANIKLGDVASNVLGVSSLAMLRALIEGQLTPAEMAQLARGRMRSKQAELEAALTGVMSDHQRFLLSSLLRQVDFHDQEIAVLDAEIEKRLGSHDELVDRLDEIPGIGRATAEHLIAEITTDMARFPTAKHLASWAKVCPGNHESGGKRLSGKTGKGSRWIRAILVEAAHAAARARGTYLGQMYHRIAARRGKKRAAIAVAHAILVIIYNMINRGTRYQDLGVDHYDKQRERQIVRNATRRIQKLGYQVTLQPIA
jgi:transposase